MSSGRILDFGAMPWVTTRRMPWLPDEPYIEASRCCPETAVKAKDGGLLDLASAKEVAVDVCLPGHVVIMMGGRSGGGGVLVRWMRKEGSVERKKPVERRFLCLSTKELYFSCACNVIRMLCIRGIYPHRSSFSTRCFFFLGSGAISPEEFRAR